MFAEKKDFFFHKTESESKIHKRMIKINHQEN